MLVTAGDEDGLAEGDGVGFVEAVGDDVGLLVVGVSSSSGVAAGEDEGDATGVDDGDTVGVLVTVGFLCGLGVGLISTSCQNTSCASCSISAEL